MESEIFSPPRDSVKCCDCECSCSLATGSSDTWIRSVKRKYDEFGDANRFYIPGMDFHLNARVEAGNECVALRETVSSQQQAIQDLYSELEEERNASSSAANEAMSMILRLQREKAEVQMEARQFKRFVEEKMAHDQEELLALEDLLYKRDQTLQSLTCEINAYKHRLMSYGLTEEEAEGEKSDLRSYPSMAEGEKSDLRSYPNMAEGEKSDLRSYPNMAEGEKSDLRSYPSMVDIDAQYDLPAYDYPPLKCNLNDNPGTLEGDMDVPDIEKYASHDTPRGREHLKNLEHMIFQMERIPSGSQFDADVFGNKNVLDKVVVGQSPRRPRHHRMFSTDSSSSLKGTSKEINTEIFVDSARFNGSSKTLRTDEHSHSKKTDNISDVGDDMSDRIYTIDSIHSRVSYTGAREANVEVGIDNYMSTPRASMNRLDHSDSDVNKLSMRLQTLEADRDSMRQTIISMRAEKAQIFQHLFKEITPERQLPLRKASLLGTISFISVLKWMVSFVFWRKKARRSKYLCGMTANNVGLLMLLEKGPRMRQWRCLASTQV